METVQPDVIIGTETWLTKDTGNGEIFPAELGFDVILRSFCFSVYCGVLWLFVLVMMWLKGLQCKSRYRQDRKLTLCSEH
jgi:hypothetical protein